MINIIKISIISFEKLEALRYAHYLKEDGVIIVNDCVINPMTVVTVGDIVDVKVIGIDMNKKRVALSMKI